MTDFNRARNAFLNNVLLTVDYDTREELKLAIAKKNIDYAFSKEFERKWEEEHFRDLHPALKDLHNQYQEMEALLKKEETK